MQIRPIVDRAQDVTVDFSSIVKDNILLSSLVVFWGTVKLGDVTHIVYVKSEVYNPFLINERLTIEISNINKSLGKEGYSYILVGPGRWGSSDSWLGIPVKWTDISFAIVIVKSILDGYSVEPSQGTHFFHNLTSLGVGYFTITIKMVESLMKWLNMHPAIYESDHLRVVSFSTPMNILMDGLHSKGVILKPVADF